jgi:hypothetical protein
MQLILPVFCLTAGLKMVLWTRCSTQGGALSTSDLERPLIRVTWCARLWLVLEVLWQASSCALLRFSGSLGCFWVALWLTFLPDALLRGFFGDSDLVVSMLAGPAAMGAARASAGACSMRTPKNG